MATSAYMPPSINPVRIAFVIGVAGREAYCAFQAGFGTTAALAPAFDAGPMP